MDTLYRVVLQDPRAVDQLKMDAVVSDVGMVDFIDNHVHGIDYCKVLRIVEALRILGVTLP
jgi:hypothetical protein